MAFRTAESTAIAVASGTAIVVLITAGAGPVITASVDEAATPDGSGPACVRQVLMEVVGIGALACYAALTATRLAPVATPFSERDPDLSAPLLPETVPGGTLLPALGLGVPLAMLAIVMLGFRFSATRTDVALSALVRPAISAAVTLGVALLLASAVTNTLKNAAGRPRPNAFALCDYAGYRTAVATGNYSAYDATTTAGVPGSWSRCDTTVATEHDVLDAARSWPSGHTALMFAAATAAGGTAVVTTFADASINGGLAVTPGALVAMTASTTVTHALVGGLAALAGWVGITRITNRYHHPDDVLAGAFVGVACGAAALVRFVALRRWQPAPLALRW